MLWKRPFCKALGSNEDPRTAANVLRVLYSPVLILGPNKMVQLAFNEKQNALKSENSWLIIPTIPPFIPHLANYLTGFVSGHCEIKLGFLCQSDCTFRN